MKKLFILAIATTLFACNSNAVSNNAEAENGTSDSPAATTNASQKKFNSPDLAMFNLYGQVKKVTISSIPCNSYGEPLEGNDVCEEVIEFDKNGKIISGSFLELDFSLEGTEIKRNSKGYITKIIQGDTTYEFVWEGDKIYTIDCYWEGELTGAATKALCYSEEGTLLVVFNESVGDGVETCNRIKYSPSEFDDKGNWTTAYENKIYVDAEGDDEHEFSTSYLQYTTKRAIEYYK